MTQSKLQWCSFILKSVSECFKIAEQLQYLNFHFSPESNFLKKVWNFTIHQTCSAVTSLDDIFCMERLCLQDSPGRKDKLKRS